MELTVGVISRVFFLLLPFTFAVLTMSVLSNPAYSDILGRGNGEITSNGKSKARL